MDKLQVIKVKYNGSTCRISAQKSANGDVITFAALEGRLRASFKLPDAASITLTYTDCDGDVIILSSDQDIVDALVYQQLNPLRVELEAQVPEGYELVAKPPSVATSDSVDSSSDLSEAPSQGAAPPAAAAVADPAAVEAAAVKDGAAAAAGATPAVPANATPAAAAAAPSAQADAAGAKVQEVAALVEKQLREVLGMSDKIGSLAREYEPLLKVAPVKIAEILDAALQNGLAVSFEPVFENSQCTPPTEAPAPAAAAPAAKETATPPAPASAPATAPAPAPAPASAPAAAPAPVATPAPATSVGWDGQPVKAAGGAATTAAAASVPVHNGIVCDGCDMNPLAGVRYKSLVKYDYDLCEPCFKKAGADPSEYKVISQPVYRGPRGHGFGGAAWASPCQPGGRQHLRFGPPGPPGFGGRALHHRPIPPFGPPFFAPAADSALASCPQMKLEARFVKDITVPDNMEVLPGARFTKIWRMRNSGHFPWPQYTQVVHIGGDALGEKNAVLLEVPPGGVVPGAELDVSVDMVAPSRLGRYMSHWRLCAPGGPKFGHRVWVLIQVVAPEGFAAAPTKPATLRGPLASAPSAPTTETSEGSPFDMAAAPVSNNEKPAAAAPAPEAATVKQEVSFVKEPAPADAAAEVDPIVAAIAACGAPVALVEEVQKVEAAPAEEKDPEVAPAMSSPLAAPAAPGDAAADDYVEVAAPVQEAGAPPAASAPAAVPTEVGNFSLVDAPEDKVADAALVDGFVDTGAGLGMEFAPNGQTVPGAADPAPAARKVATAAREKMFDIEDEAEAEALDQLEGMGFEDRELNKAVLAKAGGNLFQAIEGLMNLAEWDPMLAELEEMGFDDKVLNKRIMFENGGNMKGTVKELVHLYRNKDAM